MFFNIPISNNNSANWINPIVVVDIINWSDFMINSSELVYCLSEHPKKNVGNSSLKTVLIF